MSAPGWYHDPGGAPGRIRYWDGNRWAAETSDATDSPAGGASGRRAPWLVAGVVLVAVAVAIWFIFGHRLFAAPVDTNSASPTVSGWDETKPSDPPSAGSLIECPRTGNYVGRPKDQDGWIAGGGLKYQAIPAWPTTASAIPWIHDLTTQVDVVAEGPTGWISETAIGYLRTDEGFAEPESATAAVMSCVATSLYLDFYTGRRDISSAAFDVEGRRGWHLRSEIYADAPDLPDIEGDWLDVIVVDTGTPGQLAVFVSMVTIGDTERMALVNGAISSLRIA